MGVGNTGHGVGDSRPGGNQGHAQGAGKFGVRMGHVDSGPLVAHVDDADALGVQPHPDRHDVAATQGKHPVHTAGLQKARHERGRTVV